MAVSKLAVGVVPRGRLVKVKLSHLELELPKRIGHLASVAGSGDRGRLMVLVTPCSRMSR
jgi:hypothetical protein